jgi:hypothetical protein
MASDIHSSIEDLQKSVQSTKTKDDIRVLSNLENCIRSSASVVSSASTIVGSPIFCVEGGTALQGY